MMPLVRRPAVVRRHRLDLDTISRGLGLPRSMCERFLDDGRFMGKVAESIYADIIGGTVADNENAPFDVVGPAGERIEVRSCTKAVSFASSKEVGFGRSVTSEGFQQKLDSVDHYVVVVWDSSFEMLFYPITKSDIGQMESLGIMRKNKSVGRKKFLQYLDTRYNPVT